MGRRTKNYRPVSEGVSEIMDEWSHAIRVFCYALAKSGVCTIKDVSEHFNISERTAYYDLEKWAEPIAEVLKDISSLIRVKNSDIREIALSEVEERLEKMLGMGIQAIQDALASGDAKLAADQGWALIRQLKGNPKNTVTATVTGQVGHVHAHFELPKNVADALLGDVESDRGLIGRARQLETGLREAIDVIPS